MEIKQHSSLDNLLHEIEHAVECLYNKGNIAERSCKSAINLTKNETKASGSDRVQL